MSLLALDHLRLDAGTRCLIQPLSLQIRAGEQIALIGPSGAGKTSLLHALALALRPSSGHLQLAGQDAWALSHSARHRLRRQLMLAPQHPPLPPRQRVAVSVLAGQLPGASLGRSLRILFSPSADQAREAHDALAALELGDRLWSRVDQLSGGERQRVALARLLVSKAPLWLVDEPLSALDPQRALRSLKVLQEAAQTSGRTLVCSLHQVELARTLFPRIIALREGRLFYDGPPEGLDDAAVAALYAGDQTHPTSASPVTVSASTFAGSASGFAGSASTLAGSSGSSGTSPQTGRPWTSTVPATSATSADPTNASMAEGPCDPSTDSPVHPSAHLREIDGAMETDPSASPPPPHLICR